MQKFKHPEFISTTHWNDFVGSTPKNSAEFLNLGPALHALHPCVFDSEGKNGTFFFQWKEKASVGFFPPKDVLASNNSDLEHCFWLMVDLLKILKEKLPLTDPEDVDNRTRYIKAVLDLLESINSSAWHQTNPLEELEINGPLKWDILIKRGEFKLPWYLVPSCNRSLRAWGHVELLKCETRRLLNERLIAEEEFTIRCGAVVVCLRNAVTYANKCPTDYHTALKKELLVSEFKLAYWLAKHYNFGPENYHLLQRATELDKDAGDIIDANLKKQVEAAFLAAKKFAESVAFEGYKNPLLSADTILKKFLSQRAVQALTEPETLTELRAR